MRLRDKFKELKKLKRKAFIGYIPFGFPDSKVTKDVILTLQDSGADIIELGVPFSDPLADGPIIQKATTTALKNGADVVKLFQFLSKAKDYLKIPIVIMTYYNPLLKFGISKFFKKMKNVGATAITVVDLPLEESQEYRKQAKNFDIDTIFFLTPASSRERVKKIAKASKGFMYYISVTGITGPKELNYNFLRKNIKYIKQHTFTPVCVGFGIHKKEQVRQVSEFSDGVIVGSSIVKFIDKNYRNKDFLKKLKGYIKSLTA